MCTSANKFISIDFKYFVFCIKFGFYRTARKRNKKQSFMKIWMGILERKNEHTKLNKLWTPLHSIPCKWVNSKSSTYLNFSLNQGLWKALKYSNDWCVYTILMNKSKTAHRLNWTKNGGKHEIGEVGTRNETALKILFIFECDSMLHLNNMKGKKVQRKWFYISVSVSSFFLLEITVKAPTTTTTTAKQKSRLFEL